MIRYSRKRELSVVDVDTFHIINRGFGPIALFGGTYDGMC